MFIYCLNNPIANKDENGYVCCSAMEGAMASSVPREVINQRATDYIDKVSNVYGGAYDIGKAIASEVEIGAVTANTKNYGKIFTQGRGMATSLMKKADFVRNSAKSAAKGSVLLSAATSGVTNYIDAGGFNKQFMIGWAVDTAAGVLTAAASSWIVTSVAVLIFGASTVAAAPAYAIVGATVAVGLGVGIFINGITDKLKEALN